MLSPSEIGTYYLDNFLRVPGIWNLSRKHFRVSLYDGRFVKLNHFENRLNEKDLRFYCYKLKPMHVYFSVLNWLFPERVGKKYKAEYCIPLNGEYVIDVDSYLVGFGHVHKVDDHWLVCNQCLDMAKRITLQLCEVIQKYYRKIAIVFSNLEVLARAQRRVRVKVMKVLYRPWRVGRTSSSYEERLIISECLSHFERDKNDRLSLDRSSPQLRQRRRMCEFQRKSQSKTHHKR